MNQKIKIQIFSRDIPVENSIGNATYILDFIHYLHQAGYEIEYVLLNSSPNGKNPWYIIPSTLAKLANVSAKNNLRIGRVLLRFNSLFDWLSAISRLLYNLLLPEKMKNIYRSARDEKHKNYGHAIATQPWDVLATKDEVAFANSQFARLKPNVVITNYAFLGNILISPYLNETVLTVILTHDVRHQRTADFKKLGIPALESDWSWNAEAIELAKAQVLLAIQKEDAKVFQEMAPTSEVINMPISAACHTHTVNQVPGRCLFVGSNVDHNINGLQWFLDNVWTKVIQLHSNSSLHICGSVRDSIQGTFPNVHFLGRVDNLEPEYGAAEVCLVPLLAGSGLKIKLVEAMSHGRACVSTSVGVQGLGEIVGKTVLLADTAEDFATAINTLMTNPDKRKQMEEQAHQYVMEKLSPQAVYQPFVDRIEQHLQQVVNKSNKELFDNELSNGKVLTSTLISKEKSYEI
jgi:hypothetical protein